MSAMGREYDRLYARHRQAQKLAAARRGQQKCPYRQGRSVCGGRLELLVLRDGFTELHCPRCARRLAGICQDCPSPVEGQVRKALRCAKHKRALAVAIGERYRRANRAEVNRKAREYQRRIAEQAREYKRLWRKANPEKVAAHKRRANLRQPKRQYAYLRKYRRTHAEKRYQDGRRCLGGCGLILKGMAKKCQDCKAAARLQALRALGRAA